MNDNARLVPNASFFYEEVKYDYVISEQMKKVWAVELDLLYQFDSIMRKNGLRYWAIAGTLLGAIRHQGMIPWDDDIDVAVPRKDYEILCSIAAQEFNEPYFFQTTYSDIGCVRGHAQLRNSLTTGILKVEKGKVCFNQGIFIDIFPLDNIPDNEEGKNRFLVKLLRKKKKCHWKAINVDGISEDNQNLIKYVKKLQQNVLNHVSSYKKDFQKYEKMCQKYNNIQCKEWGMISFMPLECRFHWEKEWFLETEYVKFEYLNIPIPIMYDKILEKSYGNYMEIVKGGSEHGGVIFDTEKSYKEYL